MKPVTRENNHKARYSDETINGEATFEHTRENNYNVYIYYERK